MRNESLRKSDRQMGLERVRQREFQQVQEITLDQGREGRKGKEERDRTEDRSCVGFPMQLTPRTIVGRCRKCRVKSRAKGM